MEVVRSIPLYQQVYNELRKGIINSEINCDTILNEVHLARDLGVSRGPVREAIRLLEKEGLIIRDNKNQLRPYKPTIEDIEHIYQCRQVLESFSAKLFATKTDEHKIMKLNKIMEEKKQLMNVINENEDITVIFTQLCTQFHDTIIDSCGNPRLKQQIQQLKSLTYLYRHHNAKGASRREQVYRDHCIILDLLKHGKSKEVESFMKEHIARDLTNLISIFKYEF